MHTILVSGYGLTPPFRSLTSHGISMTPLLHMVTGCVPLWAPASRHEPAFSAATHVLGVGALVGFGGELDGLKLGEVG